MLGSRPAWPPGSRPDATFSQKPLDPRVERPFCAPSTPALGLSLSAPLCVRLSRLPDWDFVEEAPLTPPLPLGACPGTLPPRSPILGTFPLIGPSSWNPQGEHSPRHLCLNIAIEALPGSHRSFSCGPTPALCCLPTETPAGRLHPLLPALPLPPHPWTTCLSSALARSPAKAWQEGKAVTDSPVTDTDYVPGTVQSI